MDISVLSFETHKIDVNPGGRMSMSVSAYDADGGSVLENFDIEQIVRHFGVEALLNEIGEPSARRHFEIEE